MARKTLPSPSMRKTNRPIYHLIFLLLHLLLLFPAQSRADTLPGFTTEPPFNEQVRFLTLDSSVTVFINAPPADKLDVKLPVRLVFYTLPNGNTTSQTIGRKQAEGLDWHYYIQHIGAQTRRLRQILPDENIIVAYAENSLRSWPSWRKAASDSGAKIDSVIEATTSSLGIPVNAIELSGHSGGGSFIFGFINQHAPIPGYVTRLAMLDASYAYDAAAGHPDKLADWLTGNPTATLVVYSYDDRNIMLNGKKVLSETGGTYRTTLRLVNDIGATIPLTRKEDDLTTSYAGLAGRIDIRIRDNPENKILHTVLVEKNGFIQAMTAGTPAAATADAWFGETGYSELIAP